MKILIAESRYVERMVMYQILSGYGECDFAADGLELINMYMASIKTKKPYNVISLTPELPFVDGVRVLRAIRLIENSIGINRQEQVKVMFTKEPEDLFLTSQAPYDEFDAFTWYLSKVTFPPVAAGTDQAEKPK